MTSPRLVSFAAAVAVVAASLLAAPAVWAAETPSVSWAVSPASAEGPDGRSWVELELNPGASASDHLAVRNLGTEEVTFRLDAADGYFTDKGRFNMLPSTQASDDAGLWIDAPESVTVPGNGTVVVPFTVTVPDVAEPGDHAAGLAASLVSAGASDGTSVGVESRVGFRVMTRVTGEVAPAVAVANLQTQYELSWNPFAPGRITVTGDVVNDGNVRVLVDGDASAAGVTSPLAETVDREQELLPGDSRTVSTTLDGVWPLFLIGTELHIDPTVVTVDGSTEEIDRVTASATTWAVPVPQLGVLAGVALIVFALIGGRIRSRRKLAAMLDEARAEGRRTAAEDPQEATTGTRA